MIHCDECVHLRWQETLFPAATPFEVKKGRQVTIAYPPEAELHLDTPHGYCNVGVSVTFQFPSGYTCQEWGYRPTHSCNHFNAIRDPRVVILEQGVSP